MGVVAFLRAIINGDNPGLSVAFTAMVLLLAGVFIWYIVRTTPSERI